MRQWKSRREPNDLENPPFEMPGLIWQMLRSRGFDSEGALDELMAPRFEKMRDPFVLKDMDKAVGRLLLAWKNQESVAIYADFDLDGTSGLALLYEGLKNLGFKNLKYHQPKRLSEGYGFHPEAIEELAKQGVALIITVDVGITAIKAVERASELKVDVIITDHHLPKESLPNALAVVNPNRGNCESGLGYLAGVGVAFYLFLALRKTMREKKLLSSDFDPKELLDCFVIGTLTDMVPVVNENRLLCKHGLVSLENTKRLGLRALIRMLDLGNRTLTSQEVAIRLAPKLNALSRMELGIRPIDVFMAETEQDAQKIMNQVLKFNEMRVQFQSSAETHAIKQVQSRGSDQHIFVYSADYHRGVVGLVATRLAQNFNVPSFVGALSEDGTITGSARIPNGSNFSLPTIMQEASDFLIKFGGHSAAAGFELHVENAEKFQRALSDYFLNTKVDAVLPPLYFDAEGGLKEINPQFMRWYQNLEPFGTDFGAPVFKLNELSISALKTLRGGHIKFYLSQDRGQGLAALWFSPSPQHELFGMLTGAVPREVDQKFNVLVEPQWNYYNSRRTLQLLIKDIQSV